MNKKNTYIFVGVAVLVTATVALLSFNGGLFKGSSKVETAQQTCQKVRSWFDQGVLTSQHPEMVYYIGKCQGARLWDVRPAAPVQLNPEQTCRQVRSWFDQGVLTSEHPEMVYYIGKCQNANLWNLPVQQVVVTAQRCAQIQKWIVQDVFSSQHADSYEDLWACRVQFPNIVTR